MKINSIQKVIHRFTKHEIKILRALIEQAEIKRLQNKRLLAYDNAKEEEE